MVLQSFPRTPQGVRAVGVAALLVGAALFGTDHPAGLAAGLVVVSTGLVALGHASYLTSGSE